MRNDDSVHPSRQLKWRVAGLAMVVFGAGLGVVGLVRGVQDARQVAGRFIDQAKPQARQLANAADSQFRIEVNSFLKLVADDERFLGKMRAWRSTDFSKWVRQVFVVDRRETRLAYGRLRLRSCAVRCGGDSTHVWHSPIPDHPALVHPLRQPMVGPPPTCSCSMTACLAT